MWPILHNLCGNDGKIERVKQEPLAFFLQLRTFPFDKMFTWGERFTNLGNSKDSHGEPECGQI
jgi:hypothetical protein